MVWPLIWRIWGGFRPPGRLRPIFEPIRRWFDAHILRYGQIRPDFYTILTFRWLSSGSSSLQVSEGSRSGSWSKCFLGGLGCEGPTQSHTFFRNNYFCWPCRLRRQGQQIMIFWKCAVCLSWYPRPPKYHLPQKPRRDAGCVAWQARSKDPPIQEGGGGSRPDSVDRLYLATCTPLGLKERPVGILKYRKVDFGGQFIWDLVYL